MALGCRNNWFCDSTELSLSRRIGGAVQDGEEARIAVRQRGRGLEVGVGGAVEAVAVAALARVAAGVLPVYAGSTLLDVGNLAGAGIPLLLAVLAAAAVPAGRAARMHPMEALRRQ